MLFINSVSIARFCCNFRILSPCVQIFMWQFKDNKDLLGMAFIDTDIYIHTAIALKNFILIGDISRSIQLLRYKVGIIIHLFTSLEAKSRNSTLIDLKCVDCHNLNSADPKP